MTIDYLQSQLKATLKVCPFCGSNNLYIGHFGAFSFIVQCIGCGGSGPEIKYANGPTENGDAHVDLMQQAAKGWNKRYGKPIDLNDYFTNTPLVQLVAQMPQFDNEEWHRIWQPAFVQIYRTLNATEKKIVDLWVYEKFPNDKDGGYKASNFFGEVDPSCQ